MARGGGGGGGKGGGGRDVGKGGGAATDDSAGDVLQSLRLSNPNGVKVYNVATGRTIPKWLSDQKKRSLRRDEDYRARVEILQELEFNGVSQKVKCSKDGQFFMASGIHPPQVKVYELNELAIKFERHLDAEIVDFQILTEDYSKMAFVCADRSVQIHAKFGAYHKVRTPKQARDLAYSPATCDLMMVGSTSEIYRLNLEQGRFLAPFETSCPGINCCGVSPYHGLLATGGEDGWLGCFDPRSRQLAGEMVVAGGAAGVTALRFEDEAGMLVAAGGGDGVVRVYDLRSSRPMVVKDHNSGLKVIDVKFHSGGSSGGNVRHIISTDARSSKVWSQSTAATYTVLEPEHADINDVCVWPGSGFMIMALETKRMACFFVPSLGPAPRWCSFMENLTEELEEQTHSVAYDDFKFITQEELDRLALGHLVGTNLLRAYMHGFFIDARLYNKAKNITQPFAYDKYREDKIQEKLEQQRKTRITVERKLPKVNAVAAARILARSGGDSHAQDEGGEDAPKTQFNPMGDSRFAKMFTESDFQIDEESQIYQSLHPNAPKASKETERDLLDEHFDLVDEDQDDDVSDEEEERDGGKRVKMFAAKNVEAATAFRENKSLQIARSIPLEQRLAELDKAGASGSRSGFGGNREATFRARAGYGRDSLNDEWDNSKNMKRKRREAENGGDDMDAGGRGRGRGGRGRGRGDGRGGRGGGRGGRAGGRGSGGRGGRGSRR